METSACHGGVSTHGPTCSVQTQVYRIMGAMYEGRGEARRTIQYGWQAADERKAAS